MKKKYQLLCLLIIVFGFANTYAKNNNYCSYIIKIKSEYNKNKYLQNDKLLSKSNQLFARPFTEMKKSNYNKIFSSQTNNIIEVLKSYYLIEIPITEEVETINSLKNNDYVISITPNYIYKIDSDEQAPNDPYYNSQWALQNAKVNQAWKKATGKGILIGVIDTGIDYEHEDLVNQLWVNSKEDINNNGRLDAWPSTVMINGVTGDFNGIDDDGNGYIDDVIGYDVINQELINVGDYSNPDPNPVDENGHGTYISGVIAAEHNNNIGITGIAYNSKILSVRAFDATGNAESDDIAAAIVYAAINGAKVMNFSFGEAYFSPILCDAIKFASSLGCTMIASSGNNNWDFEHYPSDDENVICVGGSTSDNKKAYNSNYGNHLKLVAPGIDVLTTTPQNQYAKKGGTSLSAPHVTAAAALLLEIDNTLTPDDISGILQASANDVGDIGWDYRFGAGILDIAEAINTVGKTNVKINYPSNQLYINKSNIKEIPITGSVITPMIDSWDLLYGKGSNPSYWDTISIGNNKIIKNDTLAKFKIENLIDTTWNIRLLCKLSNSKSIEYRNIINIVSNENPIIINNLKIFYAYEKDRKVAVFSAETNQKSILKIKYRVIGTEQFYEIQEAEMAEYTHQITFRNEVPRDTTIEAIAVAVRNDGSVANYPFTFKIPANSFPIDNMILKNYQLPLSYINNSVSTNFDNNQATIAINDVSNYNITKTKIYQFKDSSFVIIDSTQDYLIPIGFGDSNGDGIEELLSTVSGQTVLFQLNPSTAKFSEILFEERYSGRFTSAAFYDIDKDGKEDIVAFNDTAFFVYSYKNGAYSLLASTTNPFKNIGTFQEVICGDFDNDNNIEICHGDENGRIFIYEFAEGIFNLEFIDSTSTSSGANYLAKADIDGDGIAEILFGNSAKRAMFWNTDYGYSIWNYRIYKSASVNRYEMIWNEYFNGVREGYISSLGFSYRNGASAGNIDNKKGDEIIISCFPSLFVMKWNESKNTIEPFWYYPSSYTNEVLVYDFDKNGINEIGFSGFDNTKFFEFITSYQGPRTPLAFEGWALDNNSAYFQWSKIQNAEYYEVFRIFRIANQIFGEVYGTTTNNYLIIDTLMNNTEYEFAVRSVNNSLAEKESELSDIISIFTHNNIYPISIGADVNCSIININFSGRLPLVKIEPSFFVLKNIATNDSLIPSACLTTNETNASLIFNKVIPDGDYNLHVYSFKDYYNTPSIDTILNIYITNSSKSKELYLTRLQVINTSTLNLEYSEEIDEQTTLKVDNYMIAPAGKVKEILTNEADKKSVVIMLDQAERIGALGLNYTLTVKNVKSSSGIDITTGAGNTLGFVFNNNDLENVSIYPNPIKINELPDIYFSNLPARAEVQIMTLDSKLLQTLTENDGNGGVQWNGRDKDGNLLNSGVYLFKVIDLMNNSRIESKFKKFVIIK